MEKRVEFSCSQEELFESVMNLANQGQWPPGWSYRDLGSRNALGFVELEICRERVLKKRDRSPSTRRKLDVQFFGRVGIITFAGITKQASALIVRSEKVTLLRFFDDLVGIVSNHLPPKSVDEAQPAVRTGTTEYERRQLLWLPKDPPKPPEPKGRGGKIDLWLDWYHAMREGGFKCTLKNVANKSGYSHGYIKQRHMVYEAKPNQNP